MTTASQTYQIQQHLLEGKSITPLDALTLYGSFRLGARINELRKSGMTIGTEIVKSGKSRFARYTLIK